MTYHQGALVSLVPLTDNLDHWLDTQMDFETSVLLSLCFLVEAIQKR